MNITKIKLVGLGIMGMVWVFSFACKPPDETPPTVKITAPGDGDTLSGYVTIIGEAVDEDSVASITLFIDDSSVDTFNQPSFNYEWNTLVLPDSTEHTIYATSLDPAGNEGHSDTVTVYLDHGSERPAVPGIPEGPSTGNPGETLTFRATTTDPNNDSIAFQFDWGDGSDLVWTEFVASGDTVSVNKVYENEGTYKVKVKAKDVHSAYSAYSPELTVVIRIPSSFGSIEIVSNPTGAEVWLDGSNTGKYTKVLLDNVSEGQHTVALRKESYSDWDSTVTVVAEDTTRVEATLSSTGILKWKCTLGGAVNSSPAIGPDATIYVGSSDSKLYGVDPSGTKKGEYATGGFPVSSPPAIGGNGKVYFGSDDAYIYALHPDLVRYWNYKTDGRVSASPAVRSDSTVYIGSADDNLYALTPDGKFKWKYHTGGAVSSSAAIGSDGTIYFGSDDGYLYAVTSTPDSAKLVWRYSTGGMVSSSPAIGTDGTIYFGSQDTYVYALNPNGTLKWRYKTDGKVNSSPAIGTDGTICVGSDDGYLYALDPATGTLRWHYKTGLWVRSSPAVGADGSIYFGSLDGYIYALRSDGTLKWKFKTDGQVSSSPAIGSNGVIYIGSTDKNLYAIQTDSPGLASTAWPKFHHDNHNTGRAGGP